MQSVKDTYTGKRFYYNDIVLMTATKQVTVGRVTSKGVRFLSPNRISDKDKERLGIIK